jgi:hypothetical protein
MRRCYSCKWDHGQYSMARIEGLQLNNHVAKEQQWFDFLTVCIHTFSFCRIHLIFCNNTSNGEKEKNSTYWTTYHPQSHSILIVFLSLSFLLIHNSHRLKKWPRLHCLSTRSAHTSSRSAILPSLATDPSSPSTSLTCLLLKIPKLSKSLTCHGYS